MTLLDQPPTRAAAAPADTLPARFAQQVHLYPDRLAVQTATHRWTYLNLAAAAQKIAHALAQYPGTSPIALCLSHDAPLIAAIIAVWQSARPLVALDPAHPPARQQAILHASGATLLLLDANHPPFETPPSVKRLHVPVLLAENLAPADLPPLDISPDTPACIVFTSGTTGTPKGVCHSHAGLLRQCDNYSHLAHISPDDRLSLLHSLSVAASLSSLCGSLFNGATLLPYSLRDQGIAGLAHWITHEQITLLHTVPTLVRQLVRTAPRCLDSLQLLRLGGETIHPRDVELFRAHTRPTCRLCVALSSAETGALCMRLYSHADSFSSPRIALGPPLPDTTLTLLDDQNLPVPVGAIGRIRVHAPQLALGYWQAAPAGLEKFPSPSDDPAFRLFDTRDRARFTPDGQLEHCGRSDAQVKILGHRVDPAEIEAALLQIPGIDQTLVQPQIAADHCAETVLIAHFTGSSLPADGHIRRTLRLRLPAHMVPRYLIPLAEFPLLPSGKVDRHALSQTPLPASATPFFLAPRDPVEKKLATILQTVLAPISLSRQDDLFADLAASSLQAAEILAGIQRVFGISLPPAALLQSPTIERLAAQLASDVLPSSDSPLFLIKPAQGSPKPPLYVFHGGVGGLYPYCHLTAHLAPDQPVFGLQSVGLHGEAWPHLTLSAMVRHYLCEIQKSQPHGPYAFAGSCMGGLIAMEVARQLLAQGERIHLLALIETTDPRAAQKRQDFRRRLTDRIRHAGRLVRWRTAWNTDQLTTGHLRPTRGPGFRRFVAIVNAVARRRFQPLAYPGPMHLFVARDGHSPVELERRLSLGRLSESAPEIHRIPGSLDDILMPPAVETLARELQALLDAPMSAERDRTS